MLEAATKRLVERGAQNGLPTEHSRVLGQTWVSALIRIYLAPVSDGGSWGKEIVTFVCWETLWGIQTVPSCTCHQVLLRTKQRKPREAVFRPSKGVRDWHHLADYSEFQCR